MLKPWKTIVMVFGTFDFLHKGHLNFFKQARSLAKNPYLIASVARDYNVKRIKG
jgi:cytidyltransferase-like protein